MALALTGAFEGPNQNSFDPCDQSGLYFYGLPLPRNPAYIAEASVCPNFRLYDLHTAQRLAAVR